MQVMYDTKFFSIGFVKSKKRATWLVPFMCALATLARILRCVLVLLLSGHDLESCGSRGRIKKNGVTLVDMLKKTKTRSRRHLKMVILKVMMELMKVKS
jgi:hypothetical protein